jgi:protein SCO1/2
MKRFYVVLLALTWSACSALTPPPEFKGAVYSSPAPPPDFTFPSTTGGDFTLSDQDDVVTLIYFGYTFCPDICPQTLGLIRSALNLLEETERIKIDLVFVTIDPDRDSLPIMTGYLARFDPAFIGVRPEPEDLAGLTADYDAFAEAELPDPGSGAYEVSHTSVIYVVDKAGNMRLGFFTGMDPDDMAADLRILANE